MVFCPDLKREQTSSAGHDKVPFTKTTYQAKPQPSAKAIREIKRTTDKSLLICALSISPRVSRIFFTAGVLQVERVSPVGCGSAGAGHVQPGTQFGEAQPHSAVSSPLMLPPGRHWHQASASQSADTSENGGCHPLACITCALSRRKCPALSGSRLPWAN